MFEEKNYTITPNGNKKRNCVKVKNSFAISLF